MPKKKSVKRAALRFRERADAILVFVTDAQNKNLTDEHVSWIFDYAIIRLYRDFEDLMLDALVGAVNNDTATISSRTGFAFPKHLTDEVCSFLVTGGGYFDFKGRDGLIKTLKEFIPDGHYVVSAVKKPRYRESLERLSALRNFAAHDSIQAKKAARAATGMDSIGSAGAWLKKQHRLHAIVRDLRALAQEIHDAAPY